MPFTERPPILSGSTQQQLHALRDYLMRMAASLESAGNAPAYSLSPVTNGAQPARAGAAGERDAIERMRQNARELKALILKTAHRIESEMDSREELYRGWFLAQSAFGEFEENLELRIATDARGVVESYGYEAAIRSAQDSIGLVQSYLTQINGEIRRGFLEDPDRPGELAFGIAISSSLRFTGSIQSREGYEYHELEPRQTFGLYTSTGWQFWIDGHKAGWFDSLDGMLHVANVFVEDTLQLGASWRMRPSADGTELEIMFVGGN